LSIAAHAAAQIQVFRGSTGFCSRKKTLSRRTLIYKTQKAQETQKAQSSNRSLGPGVEKIVL
jgi:hypothetical protein